MKIGLFGYGKMGKEIESIALQRGHQVPLKITSQNRSGIVESDLRQCDVVIDFSTPHAILDNINFVLKAQVPMVIGTTGWQDSLKEVEAQCTLSHGSLVYGSNFSVGVNIFFALNSFLAGIMDQYPEYEPSIHEIHHTQKLDAPSGTAISLGKDILQKLKRKEQWVDHQTTDDSKLTITADRIENVPGTHIVSYSSDIDTIELKHIAHNRKGFAFGAVLAAEWIINKKGIFEVKQMFNF